MANLRILNGKSTPERLAEEFQRLLESGERVTVVEFARRVKISYHTLNHKYRDWAEKVRKIRDVEKPKPQKRSPVTQSLEKITEMDQAIEVIGKLRHQLQIFASRLEQVTKENQRLKKQCADAEQQKEHNERLRGLLISLQQDILRRLTPEQSSHLLRMIEEYASHKNEED